MNRWGFVVAALAICTACSKDEQVKEFITEHDAMVADVLKASTAKDAQQVFDARKGSLKAKLEPIKTARGFQVSKENKEALMVSLMNGGSQICTLQLRAIRDAEARNAYKTLC